MAVTPVQAVYDVLAAAASLAGETIRRGPPQDTPDQGIWVVASGGRAPIPELTSGVDMSNPRVQVMVRTKVHEWDIGYDLADKVFEAVKRAEPTGYFRCYPSTAAPIDVGKDARDRYKFSVNVELGLME